MGSRAPPFGVDDCQAESERLTALGVAFTQPPAGVAPDAIDGDTLAIGAAGAEGRILKAGTAPAPSGPGPS